MNSENSVAKSSPIIEVKGLSKIYRRKSQEITALRNISLTINKGEFIAIVGESGSGKSTLLQILGGLEIPTTGSVMIGDTDIAKLNGRKRTLFRRTNIGFVFQFFYLQPFLTLRQNIELPRMFVTNKNEDKNHVDTLAKSLNIVDRLEHLPRELSGGQIQRAAIARALANNPPILLADEPTGNLDPKSAANIIELFDKMRCEFNTTVVVVTHDRNVASHADRTITLREGSIV